MRRTRVGPDGDCGGSEVEEALVERLRNIEWPKPTPEVKQRCLEDILKLMADAKSDPSAPSEEQPEVAGGDERPPSTHGAGERHSLTRRVVAPIRQAPRLRGLDRSIRTASVL